MSTFDAAAFHDPVIAADARGVDAVVWVRAANLGEAGVDVALELWTPARAEITALRQVAPETADRLAECVRVDDRTLRLDAGRWQDGVHEFELAVALPERSPGDKILAARVGVLADGERVARAPVAVTCGEAAAREPRAGSAAPTAAAEAEPRTAVMGPADLPTGASPQPPHTGGDEAGAAAPCPNCGALPDDGDRFCEACGHKLAAG